MRRIVIVIVSVVLLLFPLVLVGYMNWDTIRDAFYKSTFVSRRSISPDYTIETKTPGYKAAITSTAFLEYIAATMKIYDAQNDRNDGLCFVC